MNPTNLSEHPEGGRYREVFKSIRPVATQKGVLRAALTHIYFSLNRGEVSRFHKVSGDEVWNLYQGAGLRLHTWNGAGRSPQTITLSAKENCFCHVVPAGVWQAAEPLEGTVLAGCSVAPGFEFDDFTLIEPHSETAQKLLYLDPELSRFVSG